jgi:hypothetical protein
LDGRCEDRSHRNRQQEIPKDAYVIKWTGVSEAKTGIIYEENIVYLSEDNFLRRYFICRYIYSCYLYNFVNCTGYIAINLWAAILRNRISIPSWNKRFVFPSASKPALGTTLPVQWVPRILSPRMKRSGHDDHWPPSNAERRYTRSSYTPILLYVFKAGCLISHLIALPFNLILM